MSLFSNWFQTKKDEDEDACLWMLQENPNQQKTVRNEFCKIVRSHYDELDAIAQDIKDLGYPAASAIFNERLPVTKKARSGELGEIMATEFAEENLGFKIPVRRIRYKDGREMALRGDDFIGVSYNNTGKDLILLKGESKSRAVLSTTTITEARKSLDRDKGRCTPISLLFVADRLLEREGEDKALGAILRKEIALKTLPPENINHALFTLTGNAQKTILEKDLERADTNRVQNVINISITDHQNFIKETYEKVAELGNK